jgi:hypothetical protein
MRGAVARERNREARKGFCLGFIAKDKVDAQGDGNGIHLQHLVDVGFEFFLFVVFLEGVAAGDDAVAVGDHSSGAVIDQHLGSDDENFLGQVPGVDQGFPPLGGVFDDIDDIAQVHHIRLGVGGHRGESRGPSRS